MSTSSAPAATASRHVGELDRERGPPRGEGGRDRGDGDVGATERVAGRGDEVGVDADRGDRGHGHVGGLGAPRLRAELSHLAVRVGALERREVDHRDREVDRPQLGGRLDRSRGERGGAGFAAHLVDARKACQEPREPRLGRDEGRGVEARRPPRSAARRRARPRRASPRQSASRPRLLPASVRRTATTLPVASRAGVGAESA